MDARRDTRDLHAEFAAHDEFAAHGGGGSPMGDAPVPNAGGGPLVDDRLLFVSGGEEKAAVNDHDHDHNHAEFEDQL